MMAIDYRAELTAKIVEALEQGTAPWQKAWDGAVAQEMSPFNPVSGVEYRGANRFSLMMAGYDDPRWCTYKQAQAEGWQVRKGEKSSLVEFWKWHDQVEQTDAETGEVQVVNVRREKPIVRYATVFNAAQMDNVPELDRSRGGYDWQPQELAEQILQRSGVPFLYDQADRAFYRSSQDEVHMPPRAAFPSASKFYSVALHELGHATGHESRLGRQLGNVFGSEDYAKEELRAELASFFLSSRLGIEFDVGDHASYVGAWIKALKEDKNEIFRAARDAEHITEYVMSLGLEKAQEIDKSPSTAAPARSEASTPAKPFPTLETAEPVANATAKLYINVPFKEKEEAKRLGARWDKPRTSWYVPAGIDQKPFEKWRDMPALESVDYRSDFAMALKQHGLILTKELVMDGTWQRTTVSTSKNTKALKGAYTAAFVNGVPSGYIQNFDTGYAGAWFPEGLKLSEEQRQQFERQAEENRKARAAELAVERAATAARMEAKWNKLSAAVSHPYLERKGVEAFGLRIDGDRLVTPIRDVAGKLWSLQYISPDPSKIKMYEKGGQKTGNFHLLGELDGAPAALFAEGYATAASLHMATGLPVFEVFDSGNIDAVMTAVKGKLGGRLMVVCGDDDVLTTERVFGAVNGLATLDMHKSLDLRQIDMDEIVVSGEAVRLRHNPACVMRLSHASIVAGVPRVVGEILNEDSGYRAAVLVNNVGREKALQAAEKHGCEAVFPTFTNYAPGLTDFNDVYLGDGEEAVRIQVLSGVQAAIGARTPEECARLALGKNSVVQLPQDNKRYVGQVIANTVGHSVQDVGRSTAIAHELVKLDRVPRVGEAARIEYSGGRGTVSAGGKEIQAKQR